MECKKSQNENEENSTSTNNSINKKNNINKINILESPSFNMNLDPRSLEYKIIANISNTLVDSCDSNSKKFCIVKNQKLISPFTTANTPIKIQDYLERLYKYCHINISTVILTLIYIDRLCNINKFKMTYFNIHKLILSSMLVAIKYNEDSYFSMIFYAKIGGVSKKEMIYLEFYFVTLIKFNLFVKNELFNKYNDYIFSNDDEEESEELLKMKIQEK